MWRKSKPLENGDHNALIFNFIPGQGRWTRLEQELNFYKDPLYKGERKEGRKGREREEKEEKHQALYLNKLTQEIVSKRLTN